MRLIDADKLKIKSEYMHDICGETMIRVEDVARIINEMPAIDIHPQWILCSERLPKLNEFVLVTDGNNIHISYLSNCHSLMTDDIYEWVDNYGYINFFDERKAWMPLPEPYKKKE